jgi:hypothetical protein
MLDSVIRRHMKRTGRYFEPGGPVAAPIVTGLPPHERLLGWYCNPPPWERSVIVFTDEAIYALNDETVRIALSDIVNYESPTSKSDVTGVRVRTREGFRFLRASGSFGPHGAQKDAFSLVMVIRAVVRDNLQREEGGH